MAIPFNVPSDEQPESEFVLQFQMILKRNYLNLLNEIALIRENSVPHDTSYLDRVYAPRTVEAASVPWLSQEATAAAGERTRLDLLLLSSRNNHQVLAAAPAASARRGRRQRCSSESSCCDEAKDDDDAAAASEEIVVDPASRDWTQEEDAEQLRPKQRSRGKEKSSSNGMLSKLVPASIKSSLWTAVICVIGWHLFRAR